MELLEHLIAKRKLLTEELSLLNDQIYATEENIWLADTGLTVGEKVLAKDGREWLPGIFTGFSRRYGSTSPVVHKIKKDGTQSERTFYIWSKDSIKKL